MYFQNLKIMRTIVLKMSKRTSKLAPFLTPYAYFRYLLMYICENAQYMNISWKHINTLNSFSDTLTVDCRHKTWRASIRHGSPEIFLHLLCARLTTIMKYNAQTEQLGDRCSRVHLYNKSNFHCFESHLKLCQCS